MLPFATLSDTAGGWIVLAPHVAPRAVAVAEAGVAVTMKATCHQVCTGPGNAGRSSTAELEMVSTCHPLEEGYFAFSRWVTVRTKVSTRAVVW